MVSVGGGPGNPRGILAILLAAVAATAPSETASQVLDAASALHGSWHEGRSALIAEPALQGAVRSRDPGTAVVLSVLPGLVGLQGLGSYYAGNPAHGTRHLLIGFGSIGLVIAGVTSCYSSWGVPSVWEGGCGGTSTALTAIGAVGYLVNWGWSTVVAVQDSRAYNAAHSGTASLGLAPRVSVLAGRPRVTLQILRIGV